jgi:hypothetical protein
LGARLAEPALPDGRWVEHAQYADALAGKQRSRPQTLTWDSSDRVAGTATVRIYLAIVT